MAAPAQHEGENHNFSDEESNHSSMYNDEIDDVLNADPITETQGAGPGDIDIANSISTPGLSFEPGATRQPPHINHNNNGCKSISSPPLPTEQEESVLYAENAYIDSIRYAISTLQQEIATSELDRKESEESIEGQFSQIMERILNKKLDLIEEMNAFYDAQRERSLVRITELTQELGQKEIEKQERIDRHREAAANRNKRVNSDGFIDIDCDLDDIADDHNDHDDDEKKDSFAATIAKTGKRLSIFGDKLKKAANLAMSQLDALRNPEKPEQIKRAWYWTHDKLRVFVPRQELNALIETEIRLSAEYWNMNVLNDYVFAMDDATLWRLNQGGWFNAFGTMKVRKGQNKRWNIRIIDRSGSDAVRLQKQHRRNGSYPGYPGSKMIKTTNLMVGVVASSKCTVQDKDGGFWEKGMDGYALSVSDGKIYHKKGKGKSYGIIDVPISGDGVIGIDLDMMITPGKESQHKSKLGAETDGGTLKFYVNGKDLGIAFYGLDIEREYSLAVALDSGAIAVQIVE